MKRQRQASDDDDNKHVNQNLITSDLYDTFMNLNTAKPEQVKYDLELYLIEFRKRYEFHSNFDITLRMLYETQQIQTDNEINQCLVKTLIKNLIAIVTSYIDIFDDREKQIVDLFVPLQNRPICPCTNSNCLYMTTMRMGPSESIYNLHIYNNRQYHSLVKIFCKVHGKIGLQYYLLKCTTKSCMLPSQTIIDALKVLKSNLIL